MLIMILVFQVMRRDYAYNRARTVLGTHSEIRGQRQWANEYVNKSIFAHFRL